MHITVITELSTLRHIHDFFRTRNYFTYIMEIYYEQSCSSFRLCHDISVENFQDLDSDSCDDKTPVKDLNYVLQNHNSSIKVECARKDTNNKYSDLNDSKLGHSKVKEKNEINQKQHGNYFVDDSQRQSSYQWNSDKKQNSDTVCNITALMVLAM